MQLPLETSQIELILKKLDELESEQELYAYLETLELSELIEICYIQSCEISYIRKVILHSVNDDMSRV